jgi:transposase-like protein
MEKVSQTPGVDYPRTFDEMDDWFRTEAQCRDYIRSLCWPNGFVCERCGVAGEPWVTARGVFRCQACDGSTSLTAGTVFQDTRKPLRTWLLAMWFITNPKNGMSALGRQRALGLGSYETAWTWRHKLRRAMVRPGRDRLAGEIEVAEAYVGGPEEGKRGRASEKKSIVVAATEKNGRAIGRIRLKRVTDVSAESLMDCIREAVEPGATIHTDGWNGYAGLSAAGYTHRITVISSGEEQAHEVMPRVHSVASLLKRWLLGTLQGGVQHQHLDYYLDECTVRFNRRRSHTRGRLFYRLAQQAVAAAPSPYSSIIYRKPPVRA